VGVKLRDTYSIGERVADDPLVQVIDDFVSEAERDHIIAISGEKWACNVWFRARPYLHIPAHH
jgi:hypothetical protein